MPQADTGNLLCPVQLCYREILVASTVVLRLRQDDSLGPGAQGPLSNTVRPNTEQNKRKPTMKCVLAGLYLFCLKKYASWAGAGAEQ